MILGLSIALVILLVALWLFVMYASYKIEKGANVEEISTGDVASVADKMTRLARRGYYAASMYGKEALEWSNKKLETGFVKIVPSSKDAFEKKDELTGLTAGPLSFYLQSISESKNKGKKRLSSGKKMI